MTMVKPYLDKLSNEEYLSIARIPKNWDSDYAKIGKNFKHVFDKHPKSKGR